MASLPATVPLVQYYMSHFAASKKDLFDGDYKAYLAPYLIDGAAHTNGLGLAYVSRQIYPTTGDDLTAFLLWLATPGLNPDKDPGHIFLLHLISQVASWMGHPTTKWNPRHFPPQGMWSS